MRGLSRFFLIALVIGAVGVWSNGLAQDKAAAPEKVRFQSVDGVNLVGSFYPSTKKNPGTVLMLHSLGEDRKKKGWVNLAEELQKRGFAVLTFDFRGHGESTELNDKVTFWQKNAQGYFKGGVGKDSIDEKTFRPSYAAVLCNDIASARAYLDRRNDAGDCNTSNLILVGADTSSTLGSIWLNSEYHRYLAKPRFQNDPIGIPEKDAEGNGSFIGCVWIGVNPKPGDVTLNPASILNVPIKQKAVAMSLWYGEDDVKGMKYAKALVDNLVTFQKKGNQKIKDEKYAYTMVLPVPKSKLYGTELLYKTKVLAGEIGNYLDEVYQNRNNEWVERKFLDSMYKFRTPAGQFFQQNANVKGDKNLKWSSYDYYK